MNQTHWMPPLRHHALTNNFLNLLRVRTGTFLFLILAVPLIFRSAARAEDVHLLTSPDNRIQVAIEMPDPGSTNRPKWSATFHGKTVLTNCCLGLETKDAGELFAGVRVLNINTRSNDERIQVLFGKADHADDNFHEMRFNLETPHQRKFDVVFRCYDDAIALRYELPDDAAEHSVTITDETTSFHVEGDPTAYAQYLQNYRTSHEHNVTTVPYSELKPGTLLDMPLTFSWEDGTFAGITEAALRHYAGMSLMRPTNDVASGDLVCNLTPRPDGTKVVRPLPMETPWRVVLIGDRPGVLFESSTLYCLNDPSVIKDTSWIKPGKITFSWWNGDVYDGKRTLPILSFAMAKKYIDFCASNDIPTHSLTSVQGNPIYPWYYQTKPGVAPGPDTDVTRTRPGFDLPAIREYAESKNIRLWTWVHQAALRGKVEEAFTAFEKMGWSGMMVDFFDHDDQDSVEHAEAILESAARHHIMIHLHGVWKPTGWQRTYPNLMNHEGSLNLEYLKWSKRCTPEHDLNMAFTRLIAGPMDYHLGGFRAVTSEKFKPHNIAPNVLGTRCLMLAMYVCYDNPNPMIADYPTAYIGQPGFDFLKLVPTWWDETKVIAAKPGELLVMARRKGQTWYLGGMSAKQPRDLELPLTFLGSGKYQARLWKDAPDSEANPNHLANETLNFSANDTLKIHIALDGGFVAQISPLE
jgi:alpha-glucosidase